MKKIAIIGANGRQGRCLTDEALKRGHEVTAVIRQDRAENPEAKVLKKDLFDLLPGDLKEFDAVIDAFGTWSEDSFPQHITSLRHLCECLKGTDVRLLVVGGAACLFSDKKHETRLIDTPDFPEEFKALAQAETDAFLELEKRCDVLWTYLSPPLDFKFDGERSGKYALAGVELPFNAKGESTISYADYAVAMIDEVESARFVQKNFSVISL